MARPLATAAVAATLLLLSILMRIGAEQQAPRRGGALQLEWFPGLGLANDPDLPAAGSGSVELREAETDGTTGAPERSLLEIILMLLAAAVVAGILSFAIWSWMKRRSGPPELLTDALDEAAGSAPSGSEPLRSSIDAMLAHPDPRTAIIGAYARLLEDLAACELGRRDYEAPQEHVRRALSTLRVGAEPLRQIIALFEIARFSTGTVTEAHRQQALDALRTAAADIAGASPPRVGAALHPPAAAFP